MEEFRDIVLFLCYTGTIIICVVLVIVGILRWLGPTTTRGKRLNISSMIAFVVLCIMFLINFTGITEYLGNEEKNTEISNGIVCTSKIAIKLLMLGVVVVSVVILLLTIFLFLYQICKAFWENGESSSLAKRLAEKSIQFKEVMRTPIVAFIITWGILAIFFILPVLMGVPDENGLAEIWRSGVYVISSFVNLENEQPFYNALLTYILLFIIILGVGFAAVKILYSIIVDSFSRKNTGTLIDAYAGPMGVLAVGVALLWSIRDKKIFEQDQPITGIIGEFFKSFAVVICAMALAILTLEIIRLLMDMREKIIRQEAKYLFISLIGQVSILLLETIYSICSALGNAIGGIMADDITKIQEKIRNGIIETMNEEIKNTEKHKEDGKFVFAAFDKKETRK